MLRMSLLYTALLLAFWLLNALAPIAHIVLPAWLLLWVFVAAVCLLEFIRSVHRKTILINRQVIFLILFFLLLTSWRLLQSAWSMDSITTIQEMVKTATLGIFVVATYIGLSYVDRADLERLAATVITIVLFISCGSYIYLLVNHAGQLTFFGLQEVKRYIILFGGSNIAGAMILVFGTWNWLLLLSNKRRLRNLGFLNLAIAAVLLYGIASRSSIGGFLFAGAVILIGFLWIKHRNLLVSLLLVGLIGSAIFGLIFFTPVIIEADATNELPRTFLQRTDMWRLAWDKLSDRYWMFGAGAGTNAGLTFFTFEGIGLRGGVHNALLQTWLEEGLPGLILYVWFFVWLVRAGLSVPSRTGMALVAVASGIFFRNLGESNGLLWGLLNNFLVFVSWFIVIHLLVYSRKDSQELYPKQSMPESSRLQLADQSIRLKQVYTGQN